MIMQEYKHVLDPKSDQPKLFTMVLMASLTAASIYIFTVGMLSI